MIKTKKLLAKSYSTVITHFGNQTLFGQEITQTLFGQEIAQTLFGQEIIQTLFGPEINIYIKNHPTLVVKSWLW